MRLDEYMKKLQNDPSYKKRIEEQDRIRELAIKEMKILEEPFIEDLHFYGFKEIKSSGDLLSAKIDGRLIELILRWIPKISNKQGSKEILVRALAIAKQPFDAEILLRLFDDKESSHNLKWAIGNTLASTKVLNIEGWLEEKLVSSEQPKENEMLMYAAIKNFPPEIASIYLRRLFNIFPLQVADALTYIGNSDDLNFLQNQIDQFNGPIKTRINRAIKKLQKKLKRK